MKLRFSLKWLLICFTLLSAIFFVTVVYPTSKAHRFVESVNSKTEPGYLLEGLGIVVSETGPTSVRKPTAALLDFTLNDLVHCQRRIEVVGLVPVVGGQAVTERAEVGVNVRRIWVIDTLGTTVVPVP